MIFDLALDVFFGPLEWIVGLLPEITLDLSPLELLNSYLGWVGGWFDLTSWSLVAGIIVAGEGTIWMVRAFVWIWERVPIPK